MDVQAILSLLPENVLSELAIETKVNRYSKKLQGEIIFKLLIHCILSYKDNSLRIMESTYESVIFSLLSADIKDKKSIHYSSISERLSTIKWEYFEKLYNICVTIYGKEIKERSSNITRFDSTIVTLSSQLLKVGYLLPGDAAYTRQLKFTIGFSELPTTAHLFTEQKYTSENVALKEVILLHQPTKSNAIRIFDRGITSRKTHDKLIKEKIPFISRVSAQSKHQIQIPNKLKNPVETDTLHIHSDDWAYLYSEGCQRAKYPVRRVCAVHKESGEEIVFITNIPDIPTQEITELYKRRWDIEVFFKFLKQELNFSHLVNRSENGIKVMLYATLIAAILLLVYKKKNKLSGYKIMKLKFVLDLERIIMKDIVILCDGNPELFEKRFGKGPS
jgi:hypothetical protein